MSYRSEHEEEAFQNALDEEILCNETYCPWWQEHRCSPSCPTCEGVWCEEAWQQYKDSLEDETKYEKMKSLFYESRIVTFRNLQVTITPHLTIKKIMKL